jgi:hypothetical protein
MPELNIDHDKVSFIIEKAREFEIPEVLIEDDETVPDQTPRLSGSEALGPSLVTAVERDDLSRSPTDDPAFVEARSQIRSMNIDEQCELVALAWIGRGDYAPEEWGDAVRAANEAHNNRTAEYLFGMPHLPDHLQAGLDAFDQRIEDASSRTEN